MFMIQCPDCGVVFDKDGCNCLTHVYYVASMTEGPIGIFTTGEKVLEIFKNAGITDVPESVEVLDAKLKDAGILVERTTPTYYGIHVVKFRLDEECK